MARRSPIDILLAVRTAALDSALTAALTGEPEGVHQARVASRRLREVVPILVDVAPGAAHAGEAARRVTRALGLVRELDVSATCYAEWRPHEPRHPLADVAVRRALTRSRTAAIRAARRSLSPRQRAKLRRAFEVLARGLAAVPVAAVAGTIDRRVSRRARRVLRALDRLGLLYAPERLHAVRIAVKQLRYALEVRGRLRRVATAVSLRQLRAVQTMLGRAHDLHVLEIELRRVEARLVTRSRPAAANLRRIAADIDGACRGLHATFLARQGGLRALATALVEPAERRRAA